MNLYFAIAAALSAFITLIHIFVGGPQLVVPLRKATELHPIVRETHYYCWHLVSISLGALSGLFLWSALSPSVHELAIVGTLISASFCLWGLVLVPSVRQSFRDMPQAFLFLPVAVLGGLGLYL